MCPRKHVLGGGEHWCNLANTTELSMCGGDAARCQMTLATCFSWHACVAADSRAGGRQRARVQSQPGGQHQQVSGHCPTDAGDDERTG